MVVVLALLLLAAPANPSRASANKPAAPPAPAAAPKKVPLCDGDYSDAVPAALAA